MPSLLQRTTNESGPDAAQGPDEAEDLNTHQKRKKKKETQKAHHPAPLAGREEVGGYENLPVILVENFASLTGSRTRAFRLLKSPAVDPPPKAA